MKSLIELKQDQIEKKFQKHTKFFVVDRFSLFYIINLNLFLLKIHFLTMCLMFEYLVGWIHDECVAFWHSLLV